MRLIRKGLEPESLSKWKNLENENWSPAWNSLQAPEKKDLHCALIREQGHLCCYCGSRIRRSTSHVEHLRPQSLCNEHQRLDYKNLLASCNCGYPQEGMSECEDVDPENSVPEEDLNQPVGPADALHCGYKKSDWYDEDALVSPLEADCASFFRYWSDGNLTAASDAPRQHRGPETIKRLGLNCQRLKKLRFEAIEGALQGIEAFTTEERNKLIQMFDEPDPRGRLSQFCAAIVSVLREEFGLKHDR